MEAKITGRMANHWLQGTVGSHFFQAQVFNEPSEWGINDGRVSRLAIRPMGETWAASIVSYERGWDRRPKTAEERSIFEAVLAELENSPMRG